MNLTSDGSFVTEIEGRDVKSKGGFKKVYCSKNRSRKKRATAIRSLKRLMNDINKDKILNSSTKYVNNFKN